MFFKYPGIVAVSSIAPSAPAEVTIGAVNAGGPFNTTTWTFTHSNLAADDDMVIIGITRRTNSILPGPVTYAGITPTGSDEQLFDLGTDIRLYWYWISAADLPAAGTNKSVSIATGGITRGSAVAIALKGAAQSTPIFQGANATATSVASAAFTAAGGSFIGSIILNNSGADIAPAGGSGGWTAAFDGAEPNNTDWIYIGYLLNQSGSVTPSGSYTSGSNLECSINAILVNPA